MKHEIVLTTDRSMMSDYRKMEFLGFMATMPPFKVSERTWNYLFMPPIKVDRHGHPVAASYGLRKIEAALIDAGYDAAVVDPKYVKRYLKDAKVLMLSHHDYFALGPPSTEWWMLLKSPPCNIRSFLRFMEQLNLKKIKEIRNSEGRRLTVIAGGPGAWQWLYRPEYVERYGIDTIVEGEGEKVVVELVNKAFNGEKMPKFVMAGVKDAPSVEEIPTIKRPSINGFVEIMRGCPRGCKFCSVTLRPLRHYPLEKIAAEIEVNRKAGIKDVILHSEDVLLYGTNTVIPNVSKLWKLHRMVLPRTEGGLAWSHASLAAVKAAEEREHFISKLGEIIEAKQGYMGVEVGIETGSCKLARYIMPAKSAPYPVEKWKDVVIDAFRIMHEGHIVPAATLIMGLEGETEDDIIETIELVETLREYRSIIVPLFFVPMGALRDREWFKKMKMNELHRELLVKCFEHSMRWASEIVDWYIHGIAGIPVKIALNLFIRVAQRQAYKVKNIVQK